MKLLELLRIFRDEVDDTAGDASARRWSDAEALEYANDAQSEACRRARLLVDSSTPAICQLAVPAGASLVALDARVIFVRRARFTGSQPLARMTLQDMDSHNPYWSDTPPGRPFAFIPDLQTGKLAVYPPSDAARTLHLTVVREPLLDMNDLQDTPEIAPRYHRSLRYWMMVRAYGKQDSEANDPKKAASAEVLFAREFGAPSSAIDEAWIAREQLPGDGTY